MGELLMYSGERPSLTTWRLASTPRIATESAVAGVVLGAGK
jgi:hypothetical protein